ncbi:hypothetical protein [Agromyces larvae]|uniref:Uncharacterized protein n=1 Tax=Agromyces larvae TaxID=2929802 RepID=A0ABY4C9U9_9MICO|nr:hypothetical protein [Agromyces larvae]UOE45460.1 hypothetical protein MTO99_06805 [Agromyces larvae]
MARDPHARQELRWHPLQAADEIEVGVWRMVDSLGREYGEVRLVRRGPEIGYRAEYWPERHPRELVGYFRTLRASCEQVHQAQVHDNGRGRRDGFLTAGLIHPSAVHDRSAPPLSEG